ncbi:MAG: hypothetical protein ACK4I0_10630 [Brevundimonas sp.]|uniref:hypothetical protein n=1 Tax=Brevundimonas sp. TaxID=1871086 RepID=UPI00391B7388
MKIRTLIVAAAGVAAFSVAACQQPADTIAADTTADAAADTAAVAADQAAEAAGSAAASADAAAAEATDAAAAAGTTPPPVEPAPAQ